MLFGHEGVFEDFAQRYAVEWVLFEQAADQVLGLVRYIGGHLEFGVHYFVQRVSNTVRVEGRATFLGEKIYKKTSLNVLFCSILYQQFDFTLRKRTCCFKHIKKVYRQSVLTEIFENNVRFFCFF